MHTMMSDGVATVSQTAFSTVISKLASNQLICLPSQLAAVSVLQLLTGAL
jgi:hypothetical protein